MTMNMNLEEDENPFEDFEDDVPTDPGVPFPSLGLPGLGLAGPPAYTNVGAMWPRFVTGGDSRGDLCYLCAQETTRSRYERSPGDAIPCCKRCAFEVLGPEAIS